MRALLSIAVAGLVLCACSTGSGDDAAAQKPSRPHAVLIVLDEFPGDILLGPDGRIDAGRYPNFAALVGDSTWFRNAYTVVRLHNEGRAADPRRDRPAKGHRPRGTRPPALDLHRARPARLPDRDLGGGHVAVPAALLPRPARAPARDHPEPEGGAGRALRALHPLDTREPAADLLDEARAPATRAVGLPAVRPALAAAQARAAAPDAERPRLLRRLPDPPQRAAPAAPARLRGPPARPPRRPAEVAGDVRRHGDRGDGGPRLRLAGGRGDAPERHAVERRGAGSRPADREATGADARRGERRVRAHARRGAHDRRRAERPRSATGPTGAPPSRPRCGRGAR